MVSTLIFDLDGTLLNTLDDLHDSVCYALQQVGMPLLDKKDTRRFLGNGIANLVPSLLLTSLLWLTMP